MVITSKAGNASSLFRNAVTDDQWAQKVSAVRKPMGALFSRKLKSAQYLTSLPVAPDGEYDKDGRSRVQDTTSNKIPGDVRDDSDSIGFRETSAIGGSHLVVLA